VCVRERKRSGTRRGGRQETGWCDGELKLGDGELELQISSSRSDHEREREREIEASEDDEASGQMGLD